MEVQEALEREWEEEEEEEDEEVSEDYSDDGDLTDNDSEVDDGYHDRISGFNLTKSILLSSIINLHQTKPINSVDIRSTK